MKKSFSIFLLIAMFFTLFTACSGESKTPEDKVPVETTTVKDMGGAVFTLGSIDLHEFKIDTAVSGPGDKMMARYAEISNAYNCTIDFVQTEGTNESGEVITMIAAGRKVPDFYDMKAVSVYDLYKEGLLQNYKELKNLDITSTRWGTEAFLKQVNYGDGIYGIWPNDWDNPVPQMGDILLMNNLMLTAGNVTSPYELLEQGTWTWNTFSDMLKQLTVVEESKTVYGLASHTKDILVNTAIYSNGGEKVKLVNGKYVFGYTDANALEAINWTKSLFDAGVIAANGGTPEQFSAEEAVFLICDSWIGTADVFALIPWLPLNTLDNFGWMPFPYGPKGEYGSWNALSYPNQRFFAMIPTDNSPEDIALIMNVMFAPLEGSGPEGWKAYAKRQMFYDDQSFSNFTSLIENIKCEYSAILGQSVIDQINAGLNKAVSNTETATASLAAIEGIVNTKLDTELNNIG